MNVKAERLKKIEQLAAQAEREKTWAWEDTSEAHHEIEILVRALSMFWPSHLMPFHRKHPGKAVCIHTSRGCCSWVLRPAQWPLFDHLEETANHWDGHRHADKLARLGELTLSNVHDEPVKAPTKDVGREYESWRSMIVRCTNPNILEWEHYGGRGITVCLRWLGSFALFLQDMGERPPNASLDRIDVNGNYEPNNCRWASAQIQARNKRRRIA